MSSQFARVALWAFVIISPFTTLLPAYAKDIQAITKSAEQGHAKAQFNLGVMYYLGQGVPQDKEEAVKWFRIAANKGYAEAQFNLGLMYDTGKGVPQNNIRAYVWYSIAAANGTQDAAKNRDSVAKRLTPQDLSQAQREASELFEKLEIK